MEETDKANDPLSSGRPEAELLSDPRSDRDLAKACLAHISRILSGQERKRGTFFWTNTAPLIAEWFKEHPTLKAQQIHGWLKTRGVKISYPAVVKYTRTFRKKVPKAYHPLTFLPGEEAQADWCFINHPQLGKLYGFVFHPELLAVSVCPCLCPHVPLSSLSRGI